MAKEIPLTKGKVAIVDDEDYERISQFRWSAQYGRRADTWYAYRHRDDNRVVYLHQCIIAIDPTKLPDHLDGDGLNNRRSNLRAATHSQNGQNRHRQKNNTSGYRGVVFSKAARKWQASIRHQYRRIHLGQFDAIEDAAKAYDAKAQELFGVHARPSKIELPDEPEEA